MNFTTPVECWYSKQENIKMKSRIITNLISNSSFKKGPFIIVLAAAVLLTSAAAYAQGRQIGLNILLNTEVNDEIIDELNNNGRVLNQYRQIRALHMRIPENRIPEIEALSFVEAVSPDAERYGRPVDTVDLEDFADGLSTWNLDAIDVTNPGFDNRQVDYDGGGVYVAVIDSGLVDSWQQYFPQERIATEYAICFGGGGMEQGTVSTQPNKWEHDQDSHGTHVTSTIIGYSLNGIPVNGVAPMATIIPVKVLNQNGWCWSSVTAQGILYVADLEDGPLADYPVVINMSLGGPLLDAVEQAAIDYAVSKGVIIVASAGNNGPDGMGYPGAYEPVISVAASGWIGEWLTGDWWYGNVADPTNPDDFYIADWSSRELPGQDLDVAAPGSWVLGPYQMQSGWTSYYYLGGTSMASPHVAGVVALMLQKNPALTAGDAETILEGTAIYLAPGSRIILNPWGAIEEPDWGADATGAGLVDADAALFAS
jgi:subtilisin family serine protease